ncbi:MAG: 16S rRNA (uracil(1498)-N(3))-methyltransferase [Candidatus Brocadiaceae bacterium]|nr:16S rRNA (uracil(1498)-N(3))-methyltransferase [Candidatus Brocadiaceae bacterium]
MDGTESLRRFLAPDAGRVGQVVTLGAEQSRHLSTVLRVGVGARVRLFDGRGAEFAGHVERIGPAGVQVRVDQACAPRAGGEAVLTLAFAPPPGQRADVLVEKAGELGAWRIVPIVCERLQGFQATAAGKRQDRWERKAREAARQCGRARVPDVAEPVAFDRFVQSDGARVRLIGSTGEATPLWHALAGLHGPAASVTMIVGPAGGFTRRETDLAQEAGFVAVSLGPHVLRVETAAVAMLAVVTAWLAGAGPSAAGTGGGDGIRTRG